MMTCVLYVIYENYSPSETTFNSFFIEKDFTTDNRFEADHELNSNNQTTPCLNKCQWHKHRMGFLWIWFISGLILWNSFIVIFCLVRG